MRRTWVILTAGSLLLLLGTGCGSAGGVRPAEPMQPVMDMRGSGPALPAPTQLVRSSSEVPDNERLRNGQHNAVLLPHSNLDQGVYSPSWNTPADGLDKAAYGCYRFLFSDIYDGEARIRLFWKSAPDPANQVYIGLANHQLNRWQWFADEGSGINAGAADAYLSADNVLTCCVLVLGSQPCELLYMLLGDNTGPIMLVATSLDPDPTQNIGPLSVSVDASYSVAYGGEIVSYDFDFDGDGSWDVEGNTDGTVVHQYFPGNYVLRVRGTENSGKQAVYEKQIAIINQDNDPPTAVLSSNLSAGLAPLLLTLDSLLSSDPDGYIMFYEYDIDDDGEYEILREDPGIEEVMLAMLGTTTLRLRVTDNYYAQDEDEIEINLLSGWRYSTVDPLVSLSNITSVAVVGEDAAARACVAYSDYTTDQLLFCVAQNEAATSWGPVRKPVEEDGELASGPGIDLEVSPLNGLPMISCIMLDPGGNDKLSTISANDSQGLSWKLPVQISTPVRPGWSTDLEFINTDPAIAFLMEPANIAKSRLGYVLAKNPQGSSWNPVQVLAEGASGQQAIGVALLRSDNGLFNYPLVLALMEDPAYNRDILSFRAAAVDGDSWESPDFVGKGFASELHVAEVDGRPAAVAGMHSNLGSLYYARSQDGKGQQWSGTLDEIGKGGNLAFADWGGRPCICFESLQRDGLYIVRATDAQGSAWLEPFPVDTRGWYYENVSMDLVNGAPVVCYGLTFETGLFCASWKDF